MFWPILTFLALAGGLGLAWMAWRQARRSQWELTRLRAELNDARSDREQADHEGRAQQKALLDGMAEGILVLDAQQRVRLVNRVLREWFELGPETQGRTTMEILRRHELGDMINAAASQGGSREIELEIQGATPRILQVNACVYCNARGECQGTVVVFHDVTRLKRLENLRQEFVANVSHELRTPLSLIAGCVETLIHGAQQDPVAADRFLRMIQKHTERLTFLIEDILTLSQLESGRTLFHHQTIELRRAVDRLLEDFRLRNDARSIEFQNAVPPDLRARADTQRFSQVLINLLDNAIKYGKPDGRVEVGARRAGPQWIELWVKDNGPGIPAHAIERIFERFYRVDRSRSREQEGTGLGLSIVKHIVQAHGGKAWAASEPGRGASFFFTLPAAEP